MRYLITLFLCLSTYCLAWSTDSVSSCEVMMVEKLDIDGEDKKAVMQSFAPADDFLTSVYDAKTDIIREVEGRKIQAVLCQRSEVIPTLRDFQILASGIPMAISTDFDTSDSRSVTIYFKDSKFHSVVKGPDLSEDEQAELADMMSVFNLQPHELGQ